MFLVIVGAMWTADLAALTVGAWGVTRTKAAMAGGLGVTWLAYTLWLIWWVNFGDLFATGLSVTAMARAFPLVPNGTPEFGHGGVLTAYSGALVVVSTDVVWLLVILTLLLWAIPLALLVRRRAGQVTDHEDRPRLLVILLTGLGGGIACWACAAGVMAYMHSWPVPFSQRGQAFSIMFLGYLVLCVAAGMAASAAVSAAVTRAHGLTAAMVSAGVASLVGLGGVYGLAGSNGCIPPLTILATRCAWRPNGGWDAVYASPALDWTLGSVLAVGLAMLVLAAAALLRAVRSALGQAGRPARTARPAGPPPSPRVQRRRLVASVASVLVVTVGATTLLVVTFAANSGGGLFLSSFENGTAASRQEFDAALPKPGRPSAAILRMQTIAWLDVGGLKLGKELYSRLGDVQTALTTAADRLRGHTFSLHGLDGVLAPVDAACVHLLAVDRRLEAFFPVPDATLNSPWRKELTEIGVGTAACEEGVIKSRRATPANINSLLGHYFGILNDNILKAVRPPPALTEILLLAEGR
jgi:hypothetical protein